MAECEHASCGSASPGSAARFTVMLPTFPADPRVRARCRCRPARGGARALRGEFSAKTYDTVEALCADPAVDVVYVATPHQFHARARDAGGAGRQACAGRKTDGADARRLRGDDRSRARAPACIWSSATAIPSMRRSCAPAQAHRERRIRRGAHDHCAQLHRLSLPPAPPRRARHRARAAARCSIRRRIRSTSCGCSPAAA